MKSASSAVHDMCSYGCPGDKLEFVRIVLRQYTASVVFEGRFMDERKSTVRRRLSSVLFAKQVCLL